MGFNMRIPLPGPFSYTASSRRRRGRHSSGSLPSLGLGRAIRRATVALVRWSYWLMLKWPVLGLWYAAKWSYLGCRSTYGWARRWWLHRKAGQR